VYEIDLLESGDDAYVVNFRYGRRGAALKEGTKTVFPVSKADAEKIFAALEDEKRKKGYAAAGENPSFVAEAAPSKNTGSKRDKAVIKNLKAAINEEENETWPLSRIVWRAGELGLKDAAPLVLKLVDKTDQLLLYSCIRTLGRIGDQKCIPLLKEIIDGNFPSHICNMALAAVSNILEGAEKEAFLKELRTKLPESINLVFTLESGIPEAYLKDIFSRFGAGINEFCIPLYLLSRSNDGLKAAFLKTLEVVPVKAGYFKTIRQLYKAAEMLDDTDVYAIFVKKIEKARGTFSSAQTYDYAGGKWGPVLPELKKENSSLAFSVKTKNYFGRRTLRQLRRLGELESALYTKYATSILLSFDDEKDEAKAWKTSFTHYNYDSVTRRYTTYEVSTWYDSYSEYLSFYYILYANSTRYELKKGKQSWKCTEQYEPGKVFEPLREEAFARLWNQAPGDIIRLLTKSNCSRVTDFALQVFKNNASFIDHIEVQHLADLLRNSSEKVQQLGLDVLKLKFTNAIPDAEIIVALIMSSIKEARELGQQYIRSNPTLFAENVTFQSMLILSMELELHHWLEDFLKSHLPNASTGAAVIQNILDVICAKDYLLDEAHAAAIGSFIRYYYSGGVALLNNEMIFDLLLHPNGLIQGLGGKLLALKKLPAAQVPEKIIFTLLQSESALARTAAVDLLNNLDAAQLLEKKSLILSLCLSPLSDLRQSAQRLIDKLLQAEPDSGAGLVSLFLPVLTVKEKHEGLHADIYTLITGRLGAYLQHIEKKKILSLCVSRYMNAQELGILLLQKNISLAELQVPELNALADSPLLQLRETIRAHYNANIPLVKENRKVSILLADAVWEDTRRFAFDLFRTHFTAAEWDVNMFVSLCDSIKEDVQAFGREMIAKWFEKDAGFEYLAKLSQHPDSRMQLFASGFLDTYAKNNYEMLEKLSGFFVTLLSQINKGHTAKVRAISLLHEEALRDEKSALLIAGIFNRMSASAAITDKALYIKALTDIRKKYNSVNVVLTIKETPVYRKGKSHAVQL
jgi:predicted DNA-binding WGR domain protein